MPVKSILDIDVNDQKFKRFAELYAGYQEQLAKTPNIWKAASKESAAMATQFERMSAALLAQNAMTNEQKDAEDKRHKQLSDSERLWTSISKSSAKIARNVLDVGVGLLKWGSLIGGGLLGGSLFGIDKMAHSVSNSRRSAMGLGLTIGQEKSFAVNFERLLDPNFLSQVAEMKSDPSKAGPLYTMGVGTGGSTEQTATALVDAMRRKALATPENMRGLLDSMTGMNVGFETWNRLGTMDEKEYQSLRAGNRRDIGALGIDDGTARKWQEFTTQMERAGATIFKVLVQGLAPLSEPLTHLSSAFTKFVERLFPPGGSGPVQKGIEDLGHWLDSLSGKLSAPIFLSSVDSFVSDMGALADVAKTARDAIQDPLGTAGSAIKSDFMAGPLGSLFGGNFKDTWLGKAFSFGAGKMQMASIANTEESYGLPTGMLKYVYGHESSYGQDPKGMGNPFGLTGDAAKGVNRADFDPASRRSAQWLQKELKHYNGDITKALAAYNIGEGGVDTTVKQYGNKWQQHVPYIKDYISGDSDIRVVVTVTPKNKPGSSTPTSVNALAGGP